jgi:hypothetical protein
VEARLMRAFAFAALIALFGLGACDHPSGPPCTAPIPSTTLYQVYCDVLNRVLCLDPTEVDI